MPSSSQVPFVIRVPAESAIILTIWCAIIVDFKFGKEMGAGTWT